MHAIVTVVGKDRVGIIAGVCMALADLQVNVLDISQTILEGMFTMMMLVDLSGANEEFPAVAAKLNAAGENLGVSIRIQREDVFDAMHRI